MAAKVPRGYILVGVAVLLFVAVFAASPRREYGVSDAMRVSPAKGQLLMAQVIFRHGARTPLNTLYWPQTTWSDCSKQYQGAHLQLIDEAGSGQTPHIIDLVQPELPGGCRMGQLTRNGYQMALDLGSWLRERYVQEAGLVSSTYQAGEVWLRSSCIDRAVQTLQGVVTGLWPELSLEEPNQQPPVTVHASINELYEYMYGNVKTCPALGPLLLKVAAALAEKEMSDTKLQVLADKVATALQLPGGAPAVQWTKLYDWLAAMQAKNGSALPPGVTRELLGVVAHQAMVHEVQQLAPLPADHLVPDSDCTDVVRKESGPLLWRLQRNMQRAMQAHKSSSSSSSSSASSGGSMLRGAGGIAHKQQQKLPRLFLFSGHDSTITPLLAAFGTPETAWPPFTANIALELWHWPGAADEYHVRVLYNHQPLILSKPAAGIPGKGYVPLSYLSTLLEPYTADDRTHQQECGASL